MCAGLAAATGLYHFCGPHSGLHAAGVPVGSRDTQAGQQSVDSVENEQVQRALFEADPEVAKDPVIQRVGMGWPLKKKPTASTTKTTRPKLLPWASTPGDPFAEADDAAQKKILAEQPPTSAELAGETGFTKSTSNRRRLLEFQGGSTGAKIVDEKSSDSAETTGKVKVREVTESTTEFDTTQPQPAETNGVPEGESEAQLRAMFESPSETAEPAGRATVGTASKASAEVKAVSATVPQSKTISTKGRQVSKAAANQEATAADRSDDTPLPIEALKFRAQKGLPGDPQADLQQLQLTADQTEEPAAETPPAEVSAVPTLVAPQDSPDSHPTEPQIVESSPAVEPEADVEQPARVKVDQVPLKSKSASLSMKVVRPKQAPATIGDPRPVGDTAESVEPIIRPAIKPELPPEQVLANRPIELPAPEGWSAAVKLNERRKARLAELTGRPSTENVWPNASKEHRSTAEAEDRSAGVAEQQSYRVGSKPAVVLDKIEDEHGVRMLAANDSDLRDVRDAHYTAEPKLIDDEPATIPRETAEPIIVAEYAALGASVWWMRLFTAISVLFGLYGMWCCRLRSNDAEAR